MDPVHSKFPKGDPLKAIEKGGGGKFSSDLYNLAYQKDMAQKRNILYLILVAICVISTVIFVTTYTSKTYVVRVNELTGAVDTSGEIKVTNYTPRELEIKHALRTFIEDSRTVPLDPIQFKRNWDEAQAFITPEAMNKYNDFLAKDPPLQKLGKVTVQIEFKSIQKQPGTESTYQIRWREETFNINGNKSSTPVDYVGLFSVQVVPPTKEEMIAHNPLGIYVIDLGITKESGGAN